MGRAASMLQNAYNILVDKLEDNNLGDCSDGRILKWILTEIGEMIRTGMIWLGTRTSGRLF
jgi:hypothetical protein